MDFDMTTDTMNFLNRIALIGFGEVGQMLARELSASGKLHIGAFDIAFAHDASPQRAAAQALGVEVAGSAGEAAATAQLVISAVTASSALDAARSVAAGLAEGSFYLDLNSVAPSTKREAAAVVGAGRGRYVEAAVMAPVYPKRLGTPILLGGPHAADVLGIAQALGFNVSVFSDQVGSASAVKMCRSVMVKGLEALSMECFLAARRAGVEENVLASLRASFPALDWESIAEYKLERMTTHGIRRSEEMREVAKTVQELGIAPLMSTAASAHQSTMGRLGLKDRCGGRLPEGLNAVLDAIAEANPWPDERVKAAE
jgi:3-hydroxyisobutyrate dehydrogenase-like beta-hydroxyacid dehydrogenase